MRIPWEWQGIEHWTGADLMDTLGLISSQDEADDFMESYGELWADADNAIQSIRYYMQIVAYDPDDEDGSILAEFKEISKLLGIDFPTPEEVISPQHTFGTSSLGVKVAS